MEFSGFWAIETLLSGLISLCVKSKQRISLLLEAHGSHNTLKVISNLKLKHLLSLVKGKDKKSSSLKSLNQSCLQLASRWIVDSPAKKVIICSFLSETNGNWAWNWSLHTFLAASWSSLSSFIILALLSIAWMISKILPPIYSSAINNMWLNFSKYLIQLNMWLNTPVNNH